MFKKNLPEDVVIEILSRLPTDSLVRFKCVHKSWCALIKSPQFVTMQLHNNNSIHFLVGKQILIGETIRILWSLHTFDDRMLATSNIGENISFATKRLDLPVSSHNIWNSLSNLYDGIICFYDYHDRDGLIIMANLGTREFRALPGSCIQPDLSEYEPDCCPRETHAVGIGFDCKTNDYKVIRILELEGFSSSPCNPKAEVYTLSSNCWREIKYETYWFAIRYGILSSVYWNGAFYWPARKPIVNCHGILSFDFSDEAFEFRTIPEQITFSYDVIKFNDTLGFVSYTQPKLGMEKCFEIWVMGEYGANGVWTKLLSTKPLLGVYRAMGLWKSNELFLLLSSGLIASYNFSTNEMKTLPPIEGEDFIDDDIYIELYKGSLVSINKGINHCH